MFLHHARIVPDGHQCQTASVDLKNNKIIINRRFFLDYIKSFEDLAFIVLRERHHIALHYLQLVDISRILWHQNDVNISLQDFIEDTYINGIVRRIVNSDLPERFYGYGKDSKLGMERWLMHPKCFDKYKPNYDFYSGIEEINLYTMLCNIYKYHGNTVPVKEKDISFSDWVRMAYPYFIKYLNEDNTNKTQIDSETESGEDTKSDNVAQNNAEVGEDEAQSRASGGDKDQTSDNDEGDSSSESNDFWYQPISESGYESPHDSDESEDMQLEEQALHYNKAGSGSYYVSKKNIVPRTMEWDACLITTTSDSDPLDLNAQVTLDANIMDGFHQAANGLVIQAPHTDKHMPLAYMPHRVSRRDAYSLGMDALPVFWQHYIENTAQKHYGIYFDVSDSMSDYIGYLPSFLKALRNVDYTVYNFSRCVVEMQKHLCGRFYLGSGGTSYKAVGEHILDNKITHAFVITDGCGTVPKDMMPALARQLMDLILIKMGEDPDISEWDTLAHQVVDLGSKNIVAL
jgi:hypothetical protein